MKISYETRCLKHPDKTLPKIVELHEEHTRCNGTRLVAGKLDEENFFERTSVAELTGTRTLRRDLNSSTGPLILDPTFTAYGTVELVF